MTLRVYREFRPRQAGQLLRPSGSELLLYPVYLLHSLTFSQEDAPLPNPRRLRERQSSPKLPTSELLLSWFV